jgi:hypothetical protein
MVFAPQDMLLVPQDMLFALQDTLHAQSSSGDLWQSHMLMGIRHKSGQAHLANLAWHAQQQGACQHEKLLFMQSLLSACNVMVAPLEKQGLHTWLILGVGANKARVPGTNLPVACFMCPQVTKILFDHIWGQWCSDLQTILSLVTESQGVSNGAEHSGQQTASHQHMLLLHFERWLLLLKVGRGQVTGLVHEGKVFESLDHLLVC